jgi:acetyl-CoA carboxylase alpha subunit
LIMEHAYFSVISPEGCASILWKDASRAPQVAHMLRMTARELLELGLVDAVIPEPPGGAHRDPTAASSNLRHAIVEHLSLLDAVPISSLLERRRLRYRRLGFYAEILEAQDAPKMAAHG